MTREPTDDYPDGLDRHEFNRGVDPDDLHVTREGLRLIRAEARAAALADVTAAIAGLRRPGEDETARSYVDMTRAGAFNDAIAAIKELENR